MSNESRHSDQSASSRDERQNTQALIGLLENLVPLLLRFQADAFGQQGQLHIANANAARLEQQAAVAFTEDVILDSLRNVSTYLDKNADRYPGLDTYNGAVERARQALDARDYQSALSLILETYRAIAVVRSIRPELPPIRERTETEKQNASGRAVH
jgi:hypothetical protein